MDRKKITLNDLRQMKERGEKIVTLTAYDYPAAQACEAAGVEVILVGDSLGNVVLGFESTVPVTMDMMIHHSAAVRRGVKSAFIIGDMPFMSYQASRAEAVRNAGRFLQEAGCDCVKLEGGSEMAPTVRAIADAGIPVCAHIGLTPQSVAKLGGYRVQGKDLSGAQKLIDDALALQEAGADLIVFECIPSALAEAITRATDLITIGIGAGVGCDGQVLVMHDLLGLATRKPPKMAKAYANLMEAMTQAMAAYVREVKEEAFPGEEHGFSIAPEVVEKLQV